jgi:hypothetical protein
VKFQVHAAADEVLLQHAAAPCGPVNSRRRRLGTEYRMPGNPGFVRALADDCINAILSPDLEHRARRQTMQMDSAFDLGLDQVVIDVVAEVGIRLKERRKLRMSVRIVLEGQSRLLPEFYAITQQMGEPLCAYPPR